MRLTDEQVRELREHVAAGTPRPEVAQAFGVHVSLVSAYATGRKRPEAGGPMTRARRERVTGDRRLALRACYAVGVLSRERLAEVFDVTLETLEEHTRDLGVPGHVATLAAVKP